MPAKAKNVAKPAPVKEEAKKVEEVKPAEEQTTTTVEEVPASEAAAPAVVADTEPAKPKEKPIKTPHILRSNYSYTQFYCEENIYKFIEKVHLQKAIDKRKKEADKKAKTNNASGFDKVFAVFFSSFEHERKTEVENEWTSVVPMRIHSADRKGIHFQMGKDACVTWDYHVIAVMREEKTKNWFVADFDTKFPTSPENDLAAEKKSLLIPAVDYFRQTFTFTDLIGRNPPPTRFNPKKLQSTLDTVRVRVVPADVFLTYFRTDRSHMLVKKKGTEYQEPPPTHPIIDGPSPVVSMLTGVDTKDIQFYKPNFDNLLTCYINVREQRPEDNLEAYLGSTMPLTEIEPWLKGME